MSLTIHSPLQQAAAEQSRQAQPAKFGPSLLPLLTLKACRHSGPVLRADLSGRELVRRLYRPSVDT